jgi:peroxiredoxin Q/BCP
MLKVGAKAPAFRLLSDEGSTVALKDFKGRRALLFFFPRANTSG